MPDSYMKEELDNEITCLMPFNKYVDAVRSRVCCGLRSEPISINASFKVIETSWSPLPGGIQWIQKVLTEACGFLCVARLHC